MDSKNELFEVEFTDKCIEDMEDVISDLLLPFQPYTINIRGGNINKPTTYK